MIERNPVGDEVEVTFILDESSHTCPVSVAGDFNDWDVTAHRLVPDGHGAIYTTVVLKAGGRFEFRYRDASGRWFNDEAADDYSENAWGGMNGVLLS